MSNDSSKKNTQPVKETVEEEVIQTESQEVSEELRSHTSKESRELQSHTSKESRELQSHTSKEEWVSTRSMDTPIVSRLTPYPDLKEYDKWYPGAQTERQPFAPTPTPVSLEVAGDLHIWVYGVDPKGRQFINDLIDPMRVDFFEKWGVWIPPLSVSINNKWQAGRFQISLFAIPVCDGIARRDHLLVAEQPKRLDVLGVSPEPAQHPVWERPAAWVHRQHSHLFEKQLLKTWDCGEYLSLYLRTTILAHSSEFVGIQEVKTMLSWLEPEWPDLVSECLKVIPLPQLRRVLRMLAKEHVTLYPLRHILETLIDEGEHTQKTEKLVDRVRHTLQHYLCHRHAENYQILGYLLDTSLELDLYKQFKTQRSKTHMDQKAVLKRQQLWDHLFAALDQHLKMIPVDSTVAPVILVQKKKLRRPLQQLIQARFPWLDVLFVGELAPNFQVIPIATINI